jgi:hypothetical protein
MHEKTYFPSQTETLEIVWTTLMAELNSGFNMDYHCCTLLTLHEVVTAVCHAIIRETGIPTENHTTWADQQETKLNS